MLDVGRCSSVDPALRTLLSRPPLLPPFTKGSGVTVQGRALGGAAGAAGVSLKVTWGQGDLRVGSCPVQNRPGLIC